MESNTLLIFTHTKTWLPTKMIIYLDESMIYVRLSGTLLLKKYWLIPDNLPKCIFVDKSRTDYGSDLFKLKLSQI